MNQQNDSDRVQRESSLTRDAFLYGEKLQQEYEHRKKLSQERRKIALKLCFWIIPLSIVGALIFASQRKESGATIQVTTLSTTVNGKLYEKEAGPGDMQSEYVTFEDGVRVPWDAVRVKVHSLKR